MIILYSVDGSDREVKYTMSCDPIITLLRAITNFRAKLHLNNSVTVTVVNNQGIPLPLHDTLKTIYELQQEKKADHEATQKKISKGMEVAADGNGAYEESVALPPASSMILEMHVLLDGPENYVRGTIDYIVYSMRALTGDTSHRAVHKEKDVDSDSSDDYDQADDIFGNGISETDSSASNPVELSGGVSGLHFIKMNGRFQKGYCIDDVTWGGIVITEVPLISVLYPTQMAETVMRNERLLTRTYDPNAFIGESSLKGVDNEDYNKYVSIAKTYGNIIKTNDKHGGHMTIYPDLTSVRHSCYPNSILRRSNKYPYPGVIRCATAGGFRGGDDVTVLYGKVSTILFMLMPRTRRQKSMQEKYHFTCDCSRCWKENSALEATLSGAFFKGNAVGKPTQQNKLATEMRIEFDKLHVIDSTPGVQMDTPSGSKIPKNPTDLLNFVTKYTNGKGQLQLHAHHWRLSCVRRAYIKQVEFILTAQSNNEKVMPLRSIIEKRSFDVILQQIATEATFIPSGHPFYVSSYKVFMNVLKVLPDRLCASVQIKARNTPVNWRSFTLGNGVWKDDMSCSAMVPTTPSGKTPSSQPSHATTANQQPTPNTTAASKSTAKENVVKGPCSIDVVHSLNPGKVEVFTV